MLIHNYTDFSISRSGVNSSLCTMPCFGLYFKLDCDVRHLFPFINAKIEKAKYFLNPEYIQFRFQGRFCTLFPLEVLAVQFEDGTHAREFAEGLVRFLNELDEKKEILQPNYRTFAQLSAVELLNLVPRTNCGKCGEKTCLAFAAMLSKGRTSQQACPYFAAPIQKQAVYPIYDNSGRLKTTITLEIESDVIEPGSVHNDNEMPSQSVITEFQTVLTGREIEVLRYLARGATNIEISEALSISQHTVKTHVIHIFNKLGVNDRTQAAVWAAQNGIFEQ